MAGNVRFDSSSGSPEELPFPVNYPNGQRASYSNASLDRSGSFRESGDSRFFSSGNGLSRGSATSMVDVPPLSQCLMLDPITMGDQRYTRSGELRRVLGISLGSASEDNSFGAAHTKPPPPVATEELKRFRESIIEASSKARGRVKRLDESLQKLSKYCEAKKQQRNEILTNDRSGGSNLLKMANLMHRNPPDLVNQRLEDKNKNVVLNKRVRSSVAELRAEGRINGPARQHVGMGKDRDMHKDGGDGSDLVEEKTRRLPAGGEGWEKKLKRKRSVGPVFTRPMDGDGDIKRFAHPKLNNDPSLQSSDAQGFRSGSSNGTNGINKFENTSVAVTSNVRGIPKNEVEKLSLSRDFLAGSTKERIVAKAHNKVNIREENHSVNPSAVIKGKASRAARTGPVMAAGSSPNFSRSSESVDGWEQSPSVNKVNPIGGANNRKRPLPSGSSSPPMAQWGGQRPQKISRTRRTNLVSPVSNLDDAHISAEGCPPELGSKIAPVGDNGLLLAKGVANCNQQIRVKHENISSPARLSESEESAAGENRGSRSKEKGPGGNEVEERAVSALQNTGSSILLAKKNKILNKEETGDGVRRQGRSNRGSSNSRASISPMREKLDNSAPNKPLKYTKPASDKSGSKTGRPPLKKLSERKVTRLGLTPIGSPDFTAEAPRPTLLSHCESDDDRDELLAAANFACNASYLACSNSFWKKMEPVFASARLEDVSYLKQQLKSTKEHHEGLSQEEGILSQTPLSGEKDRFGSRTGDLAHQVQENGTFLGRPNPERGNEVMPLYQRVLSALITEDETEEFEEIGERSNTLLQYGRDNLPGVACLLSNFEPGKRSRTEVEYDSLLGRQAQKHGTVDRFSCNGSATFDRSTRFQAQQHNDDILLDGCRFSNTDIGMLSKFPKNGSDGLLSVHITTGISSPDNQYEQMSVDDKLMLELQSIGICIEAVPDLADGEDEAIDQDIFELQKGLDQQLDRKKTQLNKIIKAMEEAKELEERRLEHVAMDRLVELAYKKRLAIRGSSASKSGTTKVSKQVALMKRTLARCRKFEETGKSCFTEHAFRDALLAEPPRGNDSPISASMQAENHSTVMESGVQGSISGRVERLHNDKIGRVPFDAIDRDFAKTGPLLNRGKKKEVLLDDVGGSASFRTASVLGNTLSGGAKGKRSERERDKDIKNSGGKAGRASVGNSKGERKTKSKPKQKTAQLSTSGNGFINKFTESTHPVYPSTTGNAKREVGPLTRDGMPQGSSQEIKEQLDLPLHEFDSIEELGVANQDLDTWLNFEDDGLQDIDLMGLEIPMDDLSELNMF